MAKNKKRVKSEAAKKAAEKARKKRVLLKNIKFFAIFMAIAIALVAVIVVVGNLPEKKGSPVATEHAAIAVEGYGTLHVELYGNEAPETVKAFKELAHAGKYNGITIDKLLNGMLETTAISSTSTIKGEFSGNVKHKKGVLSMVLPNGNDSANGEFFIVTQTLKDLDGKSCAFGKITDMDVLNHILEDLEKIELDENGNIPTDKQIKITSVSFHDHH